MNIRPQHVYVLGTIGKGWTTRKIQRYSKTPSVPQRARWSHVGAAFYEDGYWQVIESHFNFGVHLVNLHKWLNNYKQHNIFYYANPFMQVSLLKSYIGVEYGLRDIRHMALEDLFGWNHKVPDAPGKFCSELLASCDGGTCSAHSGLPVHRVRPVDFQTFATTLPDTKVHNHSLEPLIEAQRTS